MTPDEVVAACDAILAEHNSFNYEPDVTEPNHALTQELATHNAKIQAWMAQRGIMPDVADVRAAGLVNFLVDCGVITRQQGDRFNQEFEAHLFRQLHAGLEEIEKQVREQEAEARKAAILQGIVGPVRR